MLLFVLFGWWVCSCSFPIASLCILFSPSFCLIPFFYIHVICSCYVWLPLTSNGKIVSIVLKQPNKNHEEEKTCDKNIWEKFTAIWRHSIPLRKKYRERERKSERWWKRETVRKEKSDTYSMKLWMYQKRETYDWTQKNTLCHVKWNQKKKDCTESRCIRWLARSFVCSLAYTHTHSIKNNKFVTFLSLNKNDLLVFLPWVSFTCFPFNSIFFPFFCIRCHPNTGIVCIFIVQRTMYNIFLCIAFF